MSALSSETLTLFGWIVPTSVFVAGLVGSPHCVAMCGPLVMSFGRTTRTLIAYHFGRMISYVAAGAIAGSIGHAILSSSALSIIGLALLTVLLVAFAWRSLKTGELNLHFRLPGRLGRVHESSYSYLRRLDLPKEAMSFAAGALTVFLPCLHLFAFLTGAASTGSATGGAVFMMVFWASTLPALSVAPIVLKRLLAGTSRRRAGQWATGLLLTAAFVSLFQFATQVRRTDANETPPTSPASHESMHHHHH